MHNHQNVLSYLKSSFLSSRIVKFSLVGGSGVIVNMGVLYLLTEFSALPYFLSSIIAIELSILSNFFINNLWTWSDRTEGASLQTRLFRYHVGVGITATGNYLILIGLTEWFGVHYLISNFIGIAVGTASNFVVNDLWTFKKRS